MKKTSLFTSRIRLIGCREHNLQNISVEIPKNAITVMTGISGSGKSSLAFDTLFAEGQRRYLEYLSSQFRSFVKQMPKPAVDFIEGLSPTLAVGQKGFTLYGRGTVATYTEIYDLLALLFASIGKQYSPFTGKRLIRHSRQEMVECILADYPAGTRIRLLAPVKLRGETPSEAIARLQNMGFIRLRIDDEDRAIDSTDPLPKTVSRIDVVVDRLEIKEGVRDRLASSVETALNLSQGILKVQKGTESEIRYLTEIFVCPETNLSFIPLKPQDFNFNSSHGICPGCQGRGGEEKIDETLLIQSTSIPVAEQIRAIFDAVPKKLALSFERILTLFFRRYRIQEDTIADEISPDIIKSLLQGSSDIFESEPVDLFGKKKKSGIRTRWQGIVPFLERLLQDKKTKGSLEALPCVNRKSCPACKGARLKPESLACLIKKKNIAELCRLTVTQFREEIQRWTFKGKEKIVADEILPQIEKRLLFLEQVGLGYLELDRPGKTLSDGEAHRIHLASQIGSKLSGLIYILDEPSLGLHRQDMQYLRKVIRELQQSGNTVVMVEHEKSLIAEADHVIELGPGAGKHGGMITYEGTYETLLNDPNSLTGKWLSAKKKYPAPPKRSLPPSRSWMQVNDVTLHNLSDFSVRIPLGCLVGFCGVSGSGKSTLVTDVIGAQIRQQLGKTGVETRLKGGESIKRIVLGEKLIERFSARSICATYVGLMNPLRQLYAGTRLATARGYTAVRFSLNKRGGRCEACEGLGELRVDMQLMPDLYIPCEVCEGKRYNYETLQILRDNRTIADVLSMTVEEALESFKNISVLSGTLGLMQELGLDYLTLGQPLHTLSGGEVQRLKLVADLAAKSPEPTLYILDEPSAGLHFEDIEKLIRILHRLVDSGHSVFIVEHHLDLLKQAQWLIELGPGGGPNGGRLIFEGTPAQLGKQSTPTGLLL